MSLIAHARTYVAKNIGPRFHQKRLDKLEELQLSQVLRRKNPYLFRAKDVATAAEFVKQLVDAHQSSSEEALFGDFLEGPAISICSRAFKGRKSATEGIDLEFERDGHRYVVSIKSGPNWELISGQPELYVELIEPLGYMAHERNEEFSSSYSAVLNRFTLEFAQQYCARDGRIEWPRLLQFNSGSARFSRTPS